MAMQRTTEGKSGQHSYTREGAEPFAIRLLRDMFLSYPPREQERIREDVKQKLAEELHRKQAQPSALFRLARHVYGITAQDLR